MTESKALSVVDSIRKMEPEFKMALPAYIPSERFTRVTVSAINGNPELLSADIDKKSLYQACMKAAQDGLVLDNREAALVTFVNKGVKTVQYMPMIAGVLKKMRNTGEISNISYGLVYMQEYRNGRFKYIKGDSESLTHDPILFEDKGEMIGVYAVVTLKDGAKVREFMDMKQLEKVRSVSRSGKSEYGPWNKWFEEMCVKSVLRKVSKLCPQSTEKDSDLDNVFRSDDAEDDYDAYQETETVEEAPKKRRTAAEKVKAIVQEPIDADYTETATISEEEIPM